MTNIHAEFIHELCALENMSKVPTPDFCECNLICKEDLCRCNEVKDLEMRSLCIYSGSKIQ